MKKTKVTIKDVARACGVSTQTISRVLNNRTDVSPETRQKVLQIIHDLGYQPSALARSMRLRSTTIGVIIAGLKYVGISTTLNGIAQAAETYGLNLMVKELPSFDSLDVLPLISALSAHQVQGIIYASPEVGENWQIIQRDMDQQTPPMVFLKGNPSSAPVSISFDNFAGAYSITRHLVENGYQHIAHIGGPVEWWEARERLRGWRQALLDAGLPAENHAHVAGNWSPSSGLEAFERLTHRYPRMDAVFAANDQMALAVLYRAWQTGIRVPEQLGVAGFDNLPESRYFTPPLTTVSQDLYQLGALAVRKLVALDNPANMDDSVAPDTILLSPELIIRQSSLRGR